MSSIKADTLGASAADTLDQVQRAAGPAIKAGKRQAGMLFDQSGELVDSISETGAKLGKDLIAYTKKNPLMALLLAVGAGALLVSASKSMQSRR
jgi:hypothetical protein